MSPNMAMSLALDTTRLAIAGDSVGGNMAAVVAQLAKERKGPTISYQVLFYPVTDGSMSQNSYKEFADGPWLTAAAAKYFFDAYAPNKADRKKTMVAPLAATTEQLKGLPPALIIVDENDILRDEGEEYARKLLQAGVKTTVIRVLATIHDFVMLNALADTAATKAAIDLASQELAQILGSVARRPAVRGRPSRSEGWGGLFKGEKYRIISSASRAYCPATLPFGA